MENVCKFIKMELFLKATLSLVKLVDKLKSNTKTTNPTKEAGETTSHMAKANSLAQLLVYQAFSTASKTFPAPTAPNSGAQISSFSTTVAASSHPSSKARASSNGPKTNTLGAFKTAASRGSEN